MRQQLLVINGWIVPKLIKYDTVYTKLWANDVGRDMSGENKGTLIGIFPKLSIDVGEYNQVEMQTFLSLASKPKFDIDWYDEETGQLEKGVSYSIGDYSISLKDAKRMIYKSFSFELNPNKKR